MEQHVVLGVFYKHKQKFNDLSRSPIEDLQDAEMQAEEDMLHMKMACASDPANKNPKHEDSLPESGMANEVLLFEEDAEGVESPFVTEDENSKNTFEENTSENMLSDVCISHSIMFSEHTDSGAAKDFIKAWSSTFYDPQDGEYFFDAAALAQDLESTRSRCSRPQ